MLQKTVELLRRADRSIGIALALSLVFAAGAGAVIPSAENSPIKPAIAHQGLAPLPVKLEREQPVEAIMNPASLVVRTTPIDMSPLINRTVLERLLAEQRCLAEAMYYEARGEGVDGQEAIAEVVFHRMRAASYPHSICGVVYQRGAAGHGCQFSFTCSGELDQPKSMGAWQRAKRLAGRILTGLVQLGDVTENAIAFHAVAVQPGWGGHLVKTIQIGNHVFYRAATRTRSS
ncbi:MAG TPA: cell wall hydrolase [Rhizomicrobium sp.]|jgi:spore germination cell wall hydrolase CwlJ-like protein